MDKAPQTSHPLPSGSPPMAALEPIVYWERQGEDSLCAVHCINALMQGPEFTAFSLADVALRLDREEAALLGEELAPGEASANVDDQGNFSSQVIIQALQQRNAELEVQDSLHPDVHESVASYPELELAYICNHHRHWLALRRISWQDGRPAWFNLNSRLPDGPELLPDQQLRDLVHTMLAEGSTIFVIRGSFPAPFDISRRKDLLAWQMMLNEELVVAMQARRHARLAAENQLDNALAHDLLSLAKRSQWDAVFERLAQAEAACAEDGPRYVDHIPAPRNFGLVHFAAHQGRHRELGRLLQDFGANPELRTRDGLTATDIAASVGCQKAVQTLRHTGSRNDHRTSCGSMSEPASRRRRRQDPCAGIPGLSIFN